MFNDRNLVDDEEKIKEDLEKIRQKRCDNHNKYKASHFSTNLLCIKIQQAFYVDFDTIIIL